MQKKSLILLLAIGLWFGIIFFVFSKFSKESQTPKPNSNSNSQNVETNKIIIALGDSLTAGYQLPLEEAYPAQLEEILLSHNYKYKVINVGVSGDTSKWLLKSVEWTIWEETKPSIALLVIGGNDGLRWMDINETKQNIWDIVDYLQSQNIEVVLWWMQIPPNLGLAYTEEFKGIYKEIAQEKDVFLIEFFLDWVAGKIDYNIGDGLHPNKEGYSIVAENVYNFLVDNNLLDD